MKERIYSEFNLKTMDTIGLLGNWNEQKGRLKQKFAALTDNDLLFAECKEEEVVGMLEEKLGKTKEELRNIISSI